MRPRTLFATNPARGARPARGSGSRSRGEHRSEDLKMAPSASGRKPDDSHTARIFRWLKQVGADHGLDPLAFKLAFWLSQFVNRKTGDAWPSVDTLTKFVGTDRRKVQR